MSNKSLVYSNINSISASRYAHPNPINRPVNYEPHNKPTFSPFPEHIQTNTSEDDLNSERQLHVECVRLKPHSYYLNMHHVENPVEIIENKTPQRNIRLNIDRTKNIQRKYKDYSMFSIHDMNKPTQISMHSNMPNYKIETEKYKIKKDHLSHINFKKNGYGTFSTKYFRDDRSQSQVYEYAKRLQKLEEQRKIQEKEQKYIKPLIYEKLYNGYNSSNMNKTSIATKDDYVENLGSLMLRKRHGLINEPKQARKNHIDIKKEVARWGNQLHSKNSVDESQFKTDDRIFNLYYNNLNNNHSINSDEFNALNNNLEHN